uniref:Serpin domain-containing protein n=1 Tax=Panagrolaimus davidi TaxID=227884 RepID=A0A914PSH4_9BILA
MTSQRSKKRKLDDSKSKVLKILMANRLFIFEKVSLLASYKKLVNEAFNGGIQEMQNLTTDKAVKEINKFVHDSTDGMIKEIVTEDAISNVLLVLINAVYFCGFWETPFEPILQCKFYGKTIQKIDMMEQIVDKDVGWNMRSGEEWKALGIPYQTRKAWLFIVLPKKRNGLSTLLKSFDYAVFKDITTRFVFKQVKRKDISSIHRRLISCDFSTIK